MSTIFRDFVRVPQERFTIYCTNNKREGGENEGLSCAYSLVVRLLLIIAGEEQNPGPPTAVTITLMHRTKKMKDSRKLLVYASDTMVEVNMSLYLQYSSHLKALVAATGPCR